MALHHSYGKKSTAVLNTCHTDLQKIAHLGLLWSQVDIMLVEGHRPTAEQQELFKKGLSKIDGINKKGKHNYNPSLALDFCAYLPIKGKAYDEIHLAHIAACFICAAEHLLAKGEITHRIRWGGNWDGDGVIKLDQNFQDLCHVELVPV